MESNQSLLNEKQTLSAGVHKYELQLSETLEREGYIGEVVVIDPWQLDELTEEALFAISGCIELIKLQPEFQNNAGIQERTVESFLDNEFKGKRITQTDLDGNINKDAIAGTLGISIFRNETNQVVAAGMVSIERYIGNPINPYAIYLFNNSVHPDHRSKGLGIEHSAAARVASMSNILSTENEFIVYSNLAGANRKNIQLYSNSIVLGVSTASNKFQTLEAAEAYPNFFGPKFAYTHYKETGRIFFVGMMNEDNTAYLMKQAYMPQIDSDYHTEVDYLINNFNTPNPPSSNTFNDGINHGYDNSHTWLFDDIPSINKIKKILAGNHKARVALVFSKTE